MRKAMDRAHLKRACLAALDAVAVEHPAGHQGKLAARYVLQGARGEAVELMFEKGPKTPAQLSMTAAAGQIVTGDGIRFRASPATETFAAIDPGGRPRYGRHSALKPMRRLAHADLMCFTIEREGESDRLLDRLLAS